MLMSYDALVIGGGPAGATAALMLAQAGWSVAIIEKKPFPRPKVCGEFVSATNLPLLTQLGLAEAFLRMAGPAVCKTGLFAADTKVMAELPRLPSHCEGWGRALGRERLDQWLLSSAAEAGATVWQPWTATDLRAHGPFHVCEIIARQGQERAEIKGRIVIAAHGSWEPGTLSTQRYDRAPRPSDLFGFKVHLRNCQLAPGFMPVLAFPGGYGGMVETDGRRVSFSCCICRDHMERARAQRPALPAAKAVMGYIQERCLGAREAFAQAQSAGPWLAVGPIHPGIRRGYANGVFLVGNAACEAHPIVAEGITIAMQSAWLLCTRLIRRRAEVLAGRGLEALGRSYGRACYQQFAGRIYASAVFAHLARQPMAATLVLPVLRRFPHLLTIFAHLSGKVRPLLTTT
jgi:menaquinone-9 beta-reductase